MIDGRPVAAGVALRDCASGCTKEPPKDAAIVTARALSVAAAGRHEFSVEATQADGQKVVAKGNFDIVPFTAAMAPKVKNIIILLGDGMDKISGRRAPTRTAWGAAASSTTSACLTSPCWTRWPPRRCGC